jgi:acylphosphatase
MADEIYDNLDLALECVTDYSAGFVRNVKSGDTDIAAEFLNDVLSDLRHACRLAGIDFDASIRVSENHYNAEMKGKTR